MSFKCFVLFCVLSYDLANKVKCLFFFFLLVGKTVRKRMGIKILYNYLFKFERIRINNCERLLIELT